MGLDGKKVFPECSAVGGVGVEVFAAGNMGNEVFARLIGKGRYVPRQEMRKIVSDYHWLAGLAVFPPDPFYERTEPTKFFEYMERGMPIVVSDFPVWRHLVEDEGVGIAVSPQDPQALAGAVTWLRDHPDVAADMGRVGRKAVVQRYNWNSQGYKLLDCYHRHF